MTFILDSATSVDFFFNFIDQAQLLSSNKICSSEKILILYKHKKEDDLFIISCLLKIQRQSGKVCLCKALVSPALTFCAVLDKQVNLKTFGFTNVRFKIETLAVSCLCKIPG